MKKPVVPERPVLDFPLEPEKYTRVYYYETKTLLQQYIDAHPKMDRKKLADSIYDKLGVDCSFFKNSNGEWELEIIGDEEGRAQEVSEKPISLGDILETVPGSIPMSEVVIQTVESDYPSEHKTAGIIVYRDIKNKNYDKEKRKWRSDCKRYDVAMRKYYEENDKYKIELEKYNEWREQRIKELEDSGEL